MMDVENHGGKSVARGMRHIGRHVQMMARFCSIIVHIVDVILTKQCEYHNVEQSRV